MRYKHIFLDFDDTIYDTHGNASEALRETYENFNLGRMFDSFNQFSELYWKRNHEVWAMYSRGEISRDDLIVERFLYPMRMVGGGTVEFSLQLSDWFLERTSQKGALVEGAMEMLEYLMPKYELHILSNGFTEVQFKKIKSCGVERFFRNVVLSDMIGINKPDRRIFDYALTQCSAERENVIMVGDNYDTDITGAINSGIDQIFFNRMPEFKAPVQPTFEIETLHLIKNIL